MVSLKNEQTRDKNVSNNDRIYPPGPDGAAGRKIDHFNH